MRTWTTTATVGAQPGAVLDPTTGFAGGARPDPDPFRRSAPVDFDASGLGDRRLLNGSRARVTGRLAERNVGFHVQVHEASEALELSADGPVALAPTNCLRPSVPGYDLPTAAGGSEVRASVGVRPGRGPVGRLLEQATAALLTAGPLDNAVSRIAREAVPC